MVRNEQRKLLTNISDNIFVELHVGGADHQSWQQVCSQLGFRVRERYRGLIVCKISDSVVAGLHDNVWNLGPSATLEHCGELGFRLRERDRGLIVCNRAIILSLDCMIMYELLVRPKLWNIVGLDVSSLSTATSVSESPSWRSQGWDGVVIVLSVSSWLRGWDV